MPPGSSVAALAQLCATKFRISQPDAFGLFLYKEQDYQCLAPATPAHTLPTTGYLVYRRTEHLDPLQARALSEGGCGAPQPGREEEDGDRCEVLPRTSGDKQTEARTEGGDAQAWGATGQPGGSELGGSSEEE